MHKYNYIIIGSSAAGISAINTLERLNPQATKLCISTSNQMPYNTCFLVDVLAGRKSVQDISLRVISQNSKFMVGTRVIAINREKKSIITSDNSEILYQKLLIATGVRPYVPPIAGINTAGVFMFHTLADVQAILAWIQRRNVRSAMVIGAGLTGLECADVLYGQGIAVTLLEKNKQILPTQLPLTGAQFLYMMIEKLGIFIVLDQTMTQIIAHNGRVDAVQLDKGQILPTDLVVIAAGVQPNSEIAHQAGLTMHDHHIVVDECMQTSDPSIVAAGDVAIIQDKDAFICKPRYTWVDAVQQGRIASHTMAGIIQPLLQIPLNIHSTFFGLQFHRMVMPVAYSNNVLEKITEDEYLQVTFKNDIPCHMYYLGKHLESIAAIRRAVIQKVALERV